MLSLLYVRLTIKVKVGIPESFKVGWYRHNWVEFTLATLALCVVVSYNIININKKLFALRQKNRVWPLQKKLEFF